MILTANGCVRSAQEDAELRERLGPGCYKVLTEDMPKFVAWLNEPHPELERQYREGLLGKYVGFSFFMDERSPEDGKIIKRETRLSSEVELRATGRAEIPDA